MRHQDEARQAAIDVLSSFLRARAEDSRAVLIDDLFGALRVLLWVSSSEFDSVRTDLSNRLEAAAGPYFQGEIVAGQADLEADAAVYEQAWARATEVDEKLRLLERHRSRDAWFGDLQESPWEVSEQAPPIVVFYSYKGGVGRSTALSALAIQRARRGERVVVIDADLDAPGVGTLLASDERSTARWGLVDYLLENRYGEVELSDYYQSYRPEHVTGAGEIVVFPVGRIDDRYLGKLARADFTLGHESEFGSSLQRLLKEIRASLDPSWILIDARAGLSDPAGALLGGLAHLHVLFGTFSEQSWAGLRVVLARLGRERVKADRPQADVLLVQAMVPENTQIAHAAVQAFAERSRDVFSELYFAEESTHGDASEDLWTVGDIESSDAPHVPIPLTYSQRLADFRSLSDVADHLAENRELVRLGLRVASRFGVGG